VKVILYITPRPEYYRVAVHLYSDEGKLVESTTYEKVKQVVFEECTVRLSSQLVRDEIFIVADAEKISVDLKSESILVIRGVRERSAR